jgi:glyoxylase-like metal-dependent hydrolase (beta-lactamase superfamily II)
MNDPHPPSAARPGGTPGLQFPIAEPPAGGTWHAVAPGVYWVRMPLPFALDHINLWVLRDGEGFTLVDTGYGNETTRGLWDQVIEQHIGRLAVERVIVTHFHPDHFGLAGWLTQRFGATLWMTAGEYFAAHIAAAQLPAVGREAQIALYGTHGLTAEQQDGLRQQRHSYARAVSTPPASFRRMLDGDAVPIDGRHWQVITGYGHAPEHAALYCEEIGTLISGDMVLPRISTNVSVWPTEPEGDPLRLFLRSVDRHAQLPEDTLVLPSHGLPFRGLRLRAAALHEHHRERLDEVLAACGEPSSAADMVPVLFRRKLDTHQLSFAMGEAIAHLNHLMYERRVVRAQDAHGVWRFQRT